jgi:SAM-dependent methyltransferase
MSPLQKHLVRFEKSDHFDWIARIQAKKMSPYIRAGDIVFEYGVGSGLNLAGLQCVRKIGFDQSDSVAAALEDHSIEFCRDITVLPNEFADVALCHHRLQSVLSPVDILREIRRLLNRSGRLLLFEPYSYDCRFSSHPACSDPAFYAWNAQTLANLVSDCGFRIESSGVHRCCRVRFAAEIALRLKLGEPGFRFLSGLTNILKPHREVRVIATV